MDILDKEIFYEAAKEYGTPLYLYDLNEIRRRVKIVENSLEGLKFKIFFAMKANSNPYILRFIHSFDVGADAVSLNEYKMALFSDFTPDEIIVNGNGKSTEDLDFYSRENPLCVNIDSYEEVKKLAGKRIKVALRMNPDVDARTHPHISTGLKENKFGMDFETAHKLIDTLPSNIELVGLHCHIGSQITEVEPFKEAFESLKNFVDREHLNLNFINIGGGWGIDYQDKTDGLKMSEYRSHILPILLSFNMPVYLELGRFIIGHSGYLLTKVTEVKKTHYKTFIVIDASMADLIRPTLYEAYHNIEFLSNGNEKVIADIVGRVCESGDRFAKDREVELPEIGDLGLIYDAGAYGYSMASNYNLSLRPAEVAFDGQNLILIRKREQFDDLIKLVEEKA